jgi:hypothetical protein
MRITLVLVAFGFLVSGCAVGVKHDYSLGDLDIEVDKNARVAIAVHDRRSYVRLGDKAPDFVGLSRGGFGNPFDVTTVSGGPLADDIAAAIATSIRAKGATVAIVSTTRP